MRFDKDPEMLVQPSSGKFFVRVPVKQGESIIWKDEWQDPLLPENEDFPHVDKTLLNRLKKAGLRKSGVWEVDFFYVPAAVSEKGKRPYYPYMSLIVDYNSRMIFNFLLEERKEFTPKFLEKFVNFFERMKIAPKEILVKRDEVYGFLEPLATGLDIEIEMVESLPALEEAKRSMRGLI